LARATGAESEQENEPVRELGSEGAREQDGAPIGTAAAADVRPIRSHRVTAAEVRRIARSELEAELARQLVDCRGNLAEVARRMGKDRSTIRYHLRRFGMLTERPEWPGSPKPGSGADSGAGREVGWGSGDA